MCQTVLLKDLLTCNKTRIYKSSVCNTRLANKSCQVLKIKITHLPCYAMLCAPWSSPMVLPL